MVLAELRDLISAEAIVRGVRQYATLIDNLINQELQRVTGRARYDELLTELVFTQTVVNGHEMPVPSDFQLLGTFTYTPFSFSSIGWPEPFTLSKGLPRGFETYVNGIPKFYRRVGNVFRFYPYTEFYINDTLTLAYYKKSTLILDEDDFPVDSLIQPVQLFVMSRILRMRDSKAATATYQMAERALTDSRAEANGV